jgi:hypothetical protein
MGYLTERPQARSYAKVAADSRLEPESIGFLWQKCLRWRLAEWGFR